MSIRKTSVAIDTRLAKQAQSPPHVVTPRDRSTILPGLEVAYGEDVPVLHARTATPIFDELIEMTGGNLQDTMLAECHVPRQMEKQRSARGR